jgi:hypothetical protein
LSLTRLKAISRAQRRSDRGIHKRIECIESRPFQLQLMAAEGLGIGPWEGRGEDIPRLKDGRDFNLTAGSSTEIGCLMGS